MALSRPHKNQKVIDILRSGNASAFNVWREKNPGPIDLIAADLDRIKFPAVDLSEALIGSADLSESDVSALLGLPKSAQGTAFQGLAARPDQWDEVIIPFWLCGKRV